MTQLRFNPSSPMILVDGSSYLFRAFHAMPPLSNSQGHPTGAIYGVVNMVGKLLEQYQPQQIAVVFDAKGKNFRHQLYADYKAHRPPMPEDLRQQIAPIQSIIKALGIPLLVIDGIEADDVLGTLAEQATQQKKAVLISTGDKDMAQLVNEHITLINTMNDSLMTPSTVEEKFHVKPSQIIDFLALKGDSADNIPGIPKCGDKTAAKWLAQYDSIENLIAHSDDIKGKIGENLRANIEQLKLSQQLTTIKTDCELGIQLSELHRQMPDLTQLQILFAEYELKAWLKQVRSGQIPFNKDASSANNEGNNEKSNPTVDTTLQTTKPYQCQAYETILTTEAWQEWFELLTHADLFALDTETTSLNVYQAELVGLSFALLVKDQIRACYLPLAHDYEGAPTQLDKTEVLAQLKPLLENPNAKKVGQNLKYDWHILHTLDIHLQGMTFDTMLESYCLNSVATRHNMDDLAEKYLQHNTIHYEAIAGKGKAQKTFNQIELETAAPYAAEDAEITLQLHYALSAKLEAEPNLLKVFQDIEMPLMPILAQTERNGVLLDKQMLADQSYELSQQLDALEQEAHLIAGEKFNLNSSKQLQVILFEKLELPIKKKTPKGAPSTAEPVLQALAEEGHQLPTLILQYRSLAKLKSTYTDALPKQIQSHSGRVHTSYQQAVTATGRLSSTEPNLQNIPIRTAEGRKIRQAFIAPEGYQLVAADYSQIELRIMAHLSQDEGLLQAFASGEDIHRTTAAEIFQMPLDEVTQEQRRAAKAVNFGLIYGMSAFGLAKQLQVSNAMAQDYIQRYFARYPGVQAYMEQTKAQAKQQGYVETLAGRRLYLPDINARNGQIRQYAERTAINAPMQGTAADIIKLAMIAIQTWLEQTDLDIKLLMQVHDELVFEVKNEDMTAAKAEIKKRMEQAFELKVPLIVEVGQGKNWDQAH